MKLGTVCRWLVLGLALAAICLGLFVAYVFWEAQRSAAAYAEWKASMVGKPEQAIVTLWGKPDREETHGGPTWRYLYWDTGDGLKVVNIKDGKIASIDYWSR